MIICFICYILEHSLSHFIWEDIKEGIFFSFFKTESFPDSEIHYVAQAVLEFMILLLQPPTQLELQAWIEPCHPYFKDE